MPEQKTIVASIMSSGVGSGGGGFVINGNLKRIPPHSPKLKEIETALALRAQEESIGDRRIRAQLGELSESLLASGVKGLIEEVGK